MAWTTKDSRCSVPTIQKSGDAPPVYGTSFEEREIHEVEIGWTIAAFFETDFVRLGSLEECLLGRYN